MKHLLKISDLSADQITKILNLADQLKYEKKHNIPHHCLAGKTLGMIFQKSSTRTRVSFETGIYQLGGTGLFLSSSDLQIGRGEPVQDTARVLSRYLDGIMIRTFAQQEVEDLAKYGSIPVINGLTDYAHPCQILADLMTIREYKGQLAGLKVAFIGDGNNVASSLIVGALKMGMHAAIACPKGFEPPQDILDFAFLYGDKFTLTDEPKIAAEGADCVYTDVWSSMGQEGDSARRKDAFAGIYQVNAGLMSLTNSGCIVQHCLPAHREEEITTEIFEKHANEIMDEAENRLHAQKAVMAILMGGK
jgi:ornithine carbamoyltransferase